MYPVDVEQNNYRLWPALAPLLAAATAWGVLDDLGFGLRAHATFRGLTVLGHGRCG